MQKKIALSIVAAAIILLSSVTVLTSGILFPPQQFIPPIKINPPQPAPNFTLIDQYGGQFNLDNNASGKVVVIYFGYTHCPDICPQVMKKYTDLESALGGDASRVELLIVTTDPWRDTPQAMKAWLGQFSPSIVGLTGSVTQVADVWRGYNVPPPRLFASNGTAVVDPNATPGYLEDHFAFVFFADKGHVLRFALTPDMDLNEYVQGVRYLLSMP